MTKGVMLRITIANEPADFDAKVRQPGMQWIAATGLDVHADAPPKTKFPAYWSECRNDLRLASGGRCSYSGMYLRKSEVIPVEHALPKNLRVDLAYEWSNYRYAGSRINSRKGTKHVLDPSLIPQGFDVYHLDFFCGSISVNPLLEIVAPSLFRAAKYTVSADGLGLDDGLYRSERMEVWDDYLHSSRGLPEQAQLKKANNFVWSEAGRQLLL